MIDITLLGTAALLPIPERALTSVFLACSGRGILFDCGEGTQTAARKWNVSLMKADVIALTHFHGDHILGIPGLLQTMTSLGRTEKLIVTGPKGLVQIMEPILQLTGPTTFEIQQMELPQEGLCLSDLGTGWPSGASLKAFRTEHRVASQGYSFTLSRPGKFMPDQAEKLGVARQLWGKLQGGQSVESNGVRILPEQVLGKPRKGLKFVFSGDTTECMALTEVARDADLLICEATYGENEQEALAVERGHMTFAMAARTAQQAQVRQLWLAHYSQRIENAGDYLMNASGIFEHTVCGCDGMHTALVFDRE